jgi:ABC-2 type transport system permease protein
LASWASVLPPVLGFTALGLLLSAASRSGPVGIGGPLVIGLLMQVCSLSGAAAPIRGLLLTVPFNAWHGFLVARPFYGPLEQGLITSAVYFVLCLGGTYAVFRRRDIAVS